MSKNSAEPSAPTATSPSLDRYVRQMLYAPLGTEGQERLAAGRALVCGCGALGSVVANTLARAGIGFLRIVDRDFLELNNLQRQVLYDEDDVTGGLPKAIAAANKLRKINSQIDIEPVVVDVDHNNVERLAHDVDVIVDGTDNFEIRFLLNDYAVRDGVPWVYGGCIGAEGQVMAILPGETPCLRCLIRESPPPGTTPTCDTAGILGSIVNVVASIEALEAMKIVSGNRKAVNRNLIVVDLWTNQMRQVKIDGLRDAGDCPTCALGEYSWLSGERGSHSAVLCGRNAVQLTHAAGEQLSLESLEEKLRGVGQVTRNPFLLRLRVDDFVVTVFPDGRAIVGGTDDLTTARAVYAKYIGN